MVEWRAHVGAGVVVTPEHAPLVKGTVVTATVKIGPLWVVAPCRIVYVTATPDRFGFAYGTLAGHPEEGEEAFHVIRTLDGVVSMEIVAFSRPADLLSRLGAPLSRLVQQRATGQYLDGVRKFVTQSAPG